MSEYLYSAKNNAFFPVSIQEQFESNGWDLSDAIVVENEVAAEFMGNAPSGKVRVAGSNGLPAWADEPSVPDDILYEQELKEINSSFDEDVSSLVLKFSRIGLFDGETEATKKYELYAELQERKSKYAADLDALDIKYGG